MLRLRMLVPEPDPGRDAAAINKRSLMIFAIDPARPARGPDRRRASHPAIVQVPTCRVNSGPARVYVEFYDYTLHASPDLFYAVGRERGDFVRAGERLALAIRTSRVFRRVGGIWRQVHHHGSIDDPELLACYQRAVQGS